jgi:hypothetical protein
LENTPDLYHQLKVGRKLKYMLICIFTISKIYRKNGEKYTKTAWQLPLRSFVTNNFASLHFKLPNFLQKVLLLKSEYLLKYQL